MINQSKYNDGYLEKRRKKEENKTMRIKNRRKLLYSLIFFLQIMSFLNMQSASFFKYPNTIYKHTAFIVVFFLILITARIFESPYFRKRKMVFSYRLLSGKKINGIILGFSIVVLLGMFIGAKLKLPFIPEINGANAWITLGIFSIQPAEILKVAFVINLANKLSETEENDNLNILSIGLGYLFIYFFLIMLQKDMGTAIHYVFIFCGMMFMTKIDLKKIFGVVVGGVLFLLGGMAWIYKTIDIETAGYKALRIKSYIDGLLFGNYTDKLGIGYQVQQAIYAFANGGLFGQGYANGVQKYNYLPEVHTDFIMGTLGEEFGIIGMLGILGAFFMIFIVTIAIARDCKNYFGKYLAIGLGIQIITQVIINIFVAIGLFPVFGIPMPIMSYGGSSMLTMAIVMVLIGNLSLGD